MTLSEIRIPKHLSAWIIGICMILIPLQYYQNPNFGLSAMRISQAQIFEVSAIALFSIFVLHNIYLSLFMLWSLILYFIYGFPNPSGEIILAIMGACMIYEAVYRVVNKENFHILENFMIFFAVINAIYMTMQHFGWDVVYRYFNQSDFQTDVLGFMGIKAVMGMFFAMVIPFTSRRYPKTSLLVFYPIYLSQCSAAMGAAIVSYLWNLWFISRKWFAIMCVVLSLSGIAYAYNDSHSGMFTDRFKLWHVALEDAAKRPILGWGIDSFRCVTNEKPFMYWKNVRTKESFRINLSDTEEYTRTHQYDLKKYGSHMKAGDILDPWDNPHNEYLQLFYEFGILPFILLGFFIWDMKSRFTEYVPELIPISGFFLGILVMSVGQFPFHLARVGLYIPIFLAAYYKLSDKYTEAV